MLAIRSFAHRVRLVLLAALVVALFPRATSASTITWEYDLLVHGTAIVPALNPGPIDINDPSTLPQQITIPQGTPMVVDITFDTDTPSVCPGNTQSGTYLIGFGNSNAATVRLMGYQYSASGGIEINAPVGSCEDNPVFNNGGIRLFVGGGGGVQTDPAGTLIEWFGIYGNLFLVIPPSGWLGAAYPAGLAPQPSRFGGENSFNFGGSPGLVIESDDLRLLPEPGTWLLLGTGVVGLAARRRRTLCGQNGKS